MDLQIGFTLRDRYTIQEKLGAGGMGTVYLAHDQAVDTRVAIKSNLSAGADSEEQFLKEAQVLAELRHANLPRVTDHFVLDDTQYLVMDFIPGEDLSARMKRAGIQPVADVINWARQLGEALDYMHNLNPPVIHRDIKPGNIKIMPDGSAVLVDFGLVKSSISNVTLTGARGFTPGYAPPEQYSSGQTGSFSDQYSLAATMYAMLTGTSPAEAVRRMMGEEELVQAISMNPNVPRHVSEALSCALELQPEDRFENMHEFLLVVQNPDFSGRPRVSTSRAAPVAPPAKSGGLPRWLIPVGLGALGVLLAVVAGGALIGGGLLLNNSNNNQQDNEPTTVAVVMQDTKEKTPTSTSPLLPTDTPESTRTLAPTDIPADTPIPTNTNTPRPAPTLTGGGGLIAFVSNRSDDGTFQIYTMKPDGSDVTQITFDPGDKSQPAWSPDGTRLLYVADGGGTYGLEIFLIDLSGSEPINLTKFVEDDYDPAWSPDGSQIAFTSERVNGLRQVYVMNADGTDQAFWTRGYAVEYEPYWAPDGSVLAVVASINDAPGEIFFRTGEGEDNTKRFDLQKRLGGVDDISWSPNGEYIAYTHIKSGHREIAIVDVDERGNVIYILTNSLGNKEPDWSADSKWIVFTTTRDQNSEIYLMDAAGGQVTRLTDNEAIDKEPVWQP